MVSSKPLYLPPLPLRARVRGRRRIGPDGPQGRLRAAQRKVVAIGVAAPRECARRAPAPVEKPVPTCEVKGADSGSALWFRGTADEANG